MGLFSSKTNDNRIDADGDMVFFQNGRPYKTYYEDSGEPVDFDPRTMRIQKPAPKNWAFIMWLVLVLVAPAAALVHPYLGGFVVFFVFMNWLAIACTNAEIEETRKLRGKE